MKKLGLLLISAMLLLAACDLSNADRNSGVEEAIHARMQSGETDTIQLGHLTDFEWDEAFLFTPYTPEDSIKDEVGIKDPSGISYRDDIQLLVFAKDEKAVQYVEVSREFGDLTRPNHRKLKPKNDMLRIYKDE
ncbi:hypothetical protein JNUCC1_02195 [Lentibacillus sp. JNUCC-1]|uniref:hypothetical protein n=1 Tax=Lentibacillus sp. JNUCC-1 TaxID=2654513 RepID=UPI0012E7D83E|nr:hypothetical protein [Lentibacillus sp. JNUCC-1]MUV38357.1 hypothetical protein [Lentibacillus sp. JNUCC-1]